MLLDQFHGAGAYAISLALTLFLAAYLTPRSWWRRPNVRALLILCLGTWSLGSALLLLEHSMPVSMRERLAGIAPSDGNDADSAAAQARRAAEANADISAAAACATAAARANALAYLAPATGGPQATTLIAGQSFQTHRDLNLRASAGVHAARLSVVPAGARVTPTGARDGDWWQISAHVAGRDSIGWVSSLWLRRSGE